MSLDELDAVLSSPKRLAAMALVANSSTVEFRFIKEHLGLSDSDLSKQMSALHDAGYVKATKTARGRGGATWYKVTARGLRAFRHHLETLDALTRDSAPGATTG